MSEIFEKEIVSETEELRYEDANIDKRILRAVTEMGFENMTPIQKQAIPVLMEGRDVIGQAQTGTGKTAAFGIPLLQRVEEGDRSLQGIILCPTRELAIQAAEELRKFAKYMHGIRVLPIYGGQDIERQIKALKGGVQIIVGTPGRVMDHMRRHTIKVQNVKMVVLDEADEMLNMGFREDMETILGQVENDHQTALFSATMPQAILDITDAYQKEAVTIKVTKKELTIPLIRQYYFVVKNIYKEEVICRLLELYGFKRSIIFCNTKKMVDELTENLKNRGIQAEGLHGDMTQKQRDFVMNRFKNGGLEILIATDVAARGIDVDDLEAVFNFDIPQDIEYYVHRIGRTGRAGREGMAFTFAYGRDLYKIRDIERVCKTKMTEQKVPKASQIMAIKIDKLLQSAADKASEADLATLQEKLEDKLAELEADPMEILAALVKMQVGEDLQEIAVEEPRRRNYDRRDGFERRTGENRREKGHGRSGHFTRREDGDRREGFRQREGRDRRGAREQKEFFGKNRDRSHNGTNRPLTEKKTGFKERKGDIKDLRRDGNERNRKKSKEKSR